jgi:predicted cupin superfamily sugar epimerase
MTTLSLQDADHWQETLKLELIPIGGYFGMGLRANETTYASSLPDRFGSDRQFYSTNYYMLKNEGARGTPRHNVLSLHQLNQDEQWFLLQGGGLTLHIFTKEGNYQTFTLDADTRGSEVLQAIAPGQSWFGAVQKEGSPFTLSACSTAPGWAPSDSRMATETVVKQLKETFPKQSDLLSQLFIGDQ